MDQYDIPIYTKPDGIIGSINTFYTAKFGMFTCHDVFIHHYNVIIDNDLVNNWVRRKEDQEFTWYLAVAYALKILGENKWNVIDNYRKSYKESQAY